MYRYLELQDTAFAANKSVRTRTDFCLSGDVQ